jgi:hypothetical protein
MQRVACQPVAGLSAGGAVRASSGWGAVMRTMTSGSVRMRWQVGAAGWPVPSVAGWDGLVAGAVAGRAGGVSGDVHGDAESVENDLFAGGVELVGASTGSVKGLRESSGVGGGGGGGEGGPDGAESGQVVAGVGEVGVQGRDHEAGGGRVVAVLAGGLVFLSDCLLQLSDERGSVGDAAAEGVGGPGGRSSLRRRRLRRTRRPP